MFESQLTTWQRCPVGKPPLLGVQVQKEVTMPIRGTTVVRCPVHKNKLCYEAMQGHIYQGARCHAYEGKHYIVPHRAKIMRAREKEHGKALVTWN